MTTLLPVDSDNHPIPAVRLKQSGAHALSATSNAARNAAAFDAETRVVSLYATGPVYVKFGGPTVTAASTDHYFPSGVYYDFALGGGKVPHYTHVSVLRVAADATVYVSEKE